MRPIQLTCNAISNPLGVETLQPSLSWQLGGTVPGQRQSAYRITVGHGPGTAEVWDSGRVASDQCVGVVYGGSRLRSRQRCFWQVQVWTGGDAPSDWSEAAHWEMGLLRQSDWRAQWIAGERLPWSKVVAPAPLLRRRLVLKKPVARARAYVSGLGYYELYINGQRIGDQELAPGVTRYDVAVPYQTHDVTGALRAGENVLGVILGTGWYECHTEEVWKFHDASWRDQPKLQFQLELMFADGGKRSLVSDTQWRGSTGPIVFDGLRNGETYDARLEKPGWAAPGYDDAAWPPAVIVPAPGGHLRSEQHPPIRVTDTIVPVAVREIRPGTWIYDLGQNMAGWARLRLQGPAGTPVTLRYAEKLTADGDIDPSNINIFIKSGDFQTDRYTLRGGGEEVWEPRFTYHGFQYVQVTGFPAPLTRENLQGRVVHTDLAKRGEFSCSNDLLNRIQRCALWSTRGNFHGFPTDCPHREKNGWTGDAQLSTEQVLLNFDPRTAYRDWLAQFRDVQRPSGQLPGIVPTGGWGFNWGSGPAWDSAAILIPWYLYLYDGDPAVLAENYDCMRRYLDYLATMATDHIVEFGLGDWCPPVGHAAAYKSPLAVTDTAYYYIGVRTVARVARVLGKTGEADGLERLAGRIRAAWRKRFLDSATGVVAGNCQTSLACGLYQGLVDEAEKPRVLAALVASVEQANRHIDCGILGAKYVLHALTDLGRADLAYAIATQTDFPSWGHWLAQGATTLWENWNGDSSRNHHMFSDISAWFYQGLAGINPDPAAPGFKHVIVRPNPVGDLRWVRAWHDSPYGRIESNWKREGTDFTLDLTLPPNTSGSVVLPGSQEPVGAESGTHRFTAKLPA